MKVYKLEGPKDRYYFVYHRGNDEVWVLRVSGGTLGKWAFQKFPEEKFNKFHPEGSEHKGPIADDIMKRAIDAIFKVKPETLTQGSSVWG